MRMTMRVRGLARGTLALGLAVLALPAAATVPAASTAEVEACAPGACTVRLSADELLMQAERAVLERRFDAARLMLAALSEAPGLAMERHFLEGYVASELGELEEAEKSFRAVLRIRPDMTRARLELARTLLLRGKEGAADHHFRLAGQATDLPPEIERTIRQARGIIRSQRNFTFSVDVGFVPDSNINNATDAEEIDFNLGGGPISLPLNPDARRRSGLGQTAAAQGSLRTGLKGPLSLRTEGAAQMANYPGKDADDMSLLLATGPELAGTADQRTALQGIAFSRWYAGKVAQEGFGARFSHQRGVGRSGRLGLQAEVRSIRSDYSRSYAGTTYAAYLSLERVLNRSLIGSVTLIGRRDALRSDANSNHEVGATVGIGGELPWGINAGLSANLSRSWYDAANPVFGPDPRADWRSGIRVYGGLRSVRVMGFSPALTYNYSRTGSNLPLYESARHRVEFSLARYF